MYILKIITLLFREFLLSIIITVINISINLTSNQTVPEFDTKLTPTKQNV